ncbi:acyl-CoA N-acyltransferase [Penicillium cosmopolitanum]|uniref:Acyl-CoA N-acyltransferase n=1 Tax=Penicillium cosmopolitanum TaxID=1131564 RepID=A0A9W9VQC1_9EURO|nr:acyl-CoA N-acyltransferase [Penicillium cosmopolitanum]KAJ5387372.1 acyl-CoA N-acyltransferase [Penicillium cosmopolitanum]
MASSEEYKITKLNSNDFDEWATLFRAYIDFYQTTIPDEQYRKTFDRILDTNSDLYALVMRQQQGESGDGKMIAIAHFFPQQTPWSEKNIMLLNDLFVDPAVRGKGQGRKMIQAVADASKEMGCLRLQWLTKHDNVTARRLYDTMADTSFVQYRMGL